MNILFIYIYSSPQKDHVYLIEKYSECIKNSRIIHFSIHNLNEPFLPAKKLVLFFPHLLKKLYSLVVKKNTNWEFFDVFPFIRFSFIRQMNFSAQSWIFLSLSKILNSKIVIIYNFPTKNIKKLSKTIHPYLVIGDCTEYWNDEAIKLSKSFSNYVLVNNPSLQNRLFKSSPIKVPAGYFTHNLIQKIYTKTLNQNVKKKSVVYLGSIDWRLDFSFIAFSMKNLSDYTFYFLSEELFDYDLQHQDEELLKKNQMAYKQWMEIRKLPNFKFIKTSSHSDVLKNIFRASVGIIPYKLDTEFYEHVHPVKIYFYLAAGIPIVSSEIRNIKEYENNFLKFSLKPLDFQKKIQKQSDNKISLNTRKIMLSICEMHTIEKKAERLNEIVISQ